MLGYKPNIGQSIWLQKLSYFWYSRSGNGESGIEGEIASWDFV